MSEQAQRRQHIDARTTSVGEQQQSGHPYKDKCAPAQRRDAAPKVTRATWMSAVAYRNCKDGSRGEDVVKTSDQAEATAPTLGRGQSVAVAGAAVVAAALVGLSGAGGRVALTAALLVLGLALSTTLPRLVGVPHASGTTLVLAVSAVLVGGVTFLVTSAGGLRWLTVAMAIGLAGAFLHELLRQDGRSHFTLSVAGACLGLGAFACAAYYVQAVHSYRAPGVVALIAAVAGAVAAVLALTDSRQTFPIAVLVVVVVLGVAFGAYVAWLDSSWQVMAAVLLAGLTSYAISRMTLARLGSVAPAWRSAASVAAGILPVMLVGILAYAALWLGHRH